MLGYYLGLYYCEDIPWPWQTLFSKTFSWNLPTVSEGSFIIMVGNMMSCSQTCRWGSSWEFYIWVGRQEEEEDSELGMGSLKPQSPSLWHTSFNKVITINPFKQCHTLVIKYSNLWVFGGHSHSNHDISNSSVWWGLRILIYWAWNTEHKTLYRPLYLWITQI